MLVWVSRVLMNSALDWVSFMGGLVLIGYILGGMERWANTLLWRVFGKYAILITAWIGTPIHEISHAIMCLIFHHKVEAVKLFQWGSADGTLGYVRHRFNQQSLYQKIGNFFIGSAPIFGGILTLFLFMALFIPSEFHQFLYVIKHSVHAEQTSTFNVLNFFKLFDYLGQTLFTWNTIKNPLFWCFLVLSISTASHTSLSREDVRGAVSGGVSLFLFLVIINSITGLLQLNVSLESIIKVWNLYLFSAGSLLIFFSLIRLLLSLALSGVKRVFFYSDPKRNHYF